MRYGTHFMLQLVGREKGCAFSQIIDYLLATVRDRKSTRLNSSHSQISYAVFCLKKKKTTLMYNFTISLSTARPLALLTPFLFTPLFRSCPNCIPACYPTPVLHSLTDTL